MSDRLFVSYWIRGFNATSMLRQYEKVLQAFPFSKLKRSDSQFRIYAISYTEPTLMDAPVAAPVDPAAIAASAREFQHGDVCYELEAAWDLWNCDLEWKLAPSRVVISCFGPEFENDYGDHLRIDFGLDEQFLPGPGGTEGVRMVRDNIQSLLRLVHDLDDRLRVDRRQLWSESGENFAELLQSTLAEFAAGERE
jgi:hypothetical protein